MPPLGVLSSKPINGSSSSSLSTSVPPEGTSPSISVVGSSGSVGSIGSFVSGSSGFSGSLGSSGFGSSGFGSSGFGSSGSGFSGYGFISFPILRWRAIICISKNPIKRIYVRKSTGIGYIYYRFIAIY